MARFRFLAASLLLLSVSCRASSTDDTGGTGGTAAPCTEEYDIHGGTSAGFDEQLELWSSCALPQPCEVAWYDAYKSDLGQAPTFSDMSAVTCILEALAGDDIVEVEISTNESEVPGFQIFSNTLRMLPNRVGWALQSGTMATSVPTILTLSDALKSKSYFEGCALLATDEEIYQCLMAWSDGCLGQQPVCPQ